LISRSFVKSSIIYTFAGALPVASAVILLPFYITYLPTSAYGALSICLAFSILIQILVTYSFDTSLYIYYHEFKNDYQKLSSFISSIFIFMLLLGCGVTFFFSITGEFVFKTFFTKGVLSFYPYGLISIGVGIFQAIVKIHNNLLQARGKPEVYLWSNVGSFFIIAITTIVGLQLFPGTLVGPLGGRLLAGFLASAWVLFRIFREFGFHFVSPWRVTSFSFNAYTFVYQCQQWTINYLDRFILLFFVPLSTVGIYDFAIKCVVPIELMLNGLNAAISPKVISLITQQTTKASSPEINRYFYGLVSVILMAICVTILGVPQLLDHFVHKSDYTSSIQYIPYLASIYIFKSIRLYFVLPYTILKKMKKLTMLNFLVAVLKLALMALLVYRWQLNGVILSSFFAYACEIFLLWAYLKKEYAIQFNFMKLLAVPFFLLSIILITSYWLKNDYALLLHFSYVLLCAILLGVAYRKEFKLLYTLKMLK
jgi:O-antigen/teichoic acid export membrane protein